MLLIETLKSKISDFLNSNTCFSLRLYGTLLKKKIMLMYVLRVYSSECATMCISKSCPVIKSGKLTAHDSNHRVIWALILFKPISFTSCNCKLKTAFILNAQWSDKLHSSRCFNDNLLEVPTKYLTAWYHKI